MSLQRDVPPAHRYFRTTPLMQEGSKCRTVAHVYAKRENILAPHLCHENGTGLTPACRSQTAVGRRAWGSSYALRTRQVGFAIATLIAWSLIFVGAGLFAIFA